MNEKAVHTPTPSRNSFFTNPFTVLFGAAGLFIVSQGIAAVFFLPFTQLFPSQNVELLMYSIALLAVLLLLLGATMKLIGFSHRSIGLVWPPPRRVLEVVPVFLIYATVSIALSMFATRFIPGFDIDQAQEIGFKNIQGTWQIVVAGLGLVLLTPIYEEILFRGVLFRGLRVRLPFWLSAGVASLIFALAHGQWNVAVDTFALGIALSFLVERSHSIVPAILLHMLKNGIAFTFLFLVKG